MMRLTIRFGTDLNAPASAPIASDSPTDQSPLTVAGLRAIDPPFDVLSWHHGATGGCGVESFLRWGAEPEPDWIVQLSFVVPATGIDRDSFRSHYSDHVEVARRHHPGIRRYVQHLTDPSTRLALPVPTGFAAGDVFGISELWFANADELGSRYWADDTSRDAVRIDNAEYIDFTSTWSVLCARAGSRDLLIGKDR